MRAHEAGALHGDIGNRGPAWLRTPEDVNALVPALWPRTVTRTGEGALEIGGVSVLDLAAEHGTPAYVLDEADLRARCRDFAAAFAGADVYYAGKSFLCKAVVKIINEEGLFLDVCTGGELAVALAAGFPPERIGFHGNNKSVSELTRAVRAGVGRIIVDSFDEIERLSEISERAGIRQAVLLRVTVGVEAHTHEFIATAHEDQKFGFSLAGGEALAAVRAVRDAAGLELVGLHSHIGSQIFDAGGFEVAAHRVVGLLAEVRDRLGAVLGELNLGGGLGIAYTSGDDPLDVADIARSLRDIVDRESRAYGLVPPRLAVEPGRAIAGSGTVTLYQVGTVKDVDGFRTYVSVDGGMSDNIRTALYGADYSVTLASRDSAAGPMLSRVVGKHCETGDVVVRDAWLPADLAPGDLLAVAGTGAYCRSMASNYNHVPRPPVVAVSGGQARILLHGETEADLLRLDAGVTRKEAEWASRR